MEKMKVLATELCKLTIHPTGNPAEDISFACRSRGDAITCEHGSIKVVVSGFKSIDREAWDSDAKHYWYKTTDSSGFGFLWYEADVCWTVGKQKGTGHAVLGYFADLDRLLTQLEHGAEKGAIDTLLLKVDKLAGELYGDDLLN